MDAEERFNSTKAVVFVNQPVQYDAEHGNYSSDYMNLIDFLLEASTLFEELVLFMPVGEGIGRTEITLPDNVRIRHLPHYNGPAELVRTGHRVVPRLVRAALSEEVLTADLIGTVAPSTLGAVVVPFTYYRYGKPHFFIMRGDKRATLSHRFDGQPIRNSLFQTPIKAYDRMFASISSSSDGTLFTIGDLSDKIRSYGYDVEGTTVLTPLVPRELIVDSPTVGGEMSDLLYVGRLSGEKGVDNLLRATGVLVEAGRDVHLHVVGSGPARDRLESLASTLGVDGETTFHGFVPKGPELWGHFDEADVFVLPSHTEGLPRVVAEAMGRGLPVLATAVGGIPRLIDDGRNGLLVPPDDVDALVEALYTAGEDEAFRRALAESGLETAAELTFQRETETLGRGIEDILS